MKTPKHHIEEYFSVDGGSITTIDGKTETATDIQSGMFYDYGGQNAWNGQHDERGYYMYFRAVRRDPKTPYLIAFCMFAGLKRCIVPAARMSAKKEMEARQIFARDIESFITAHIQSHNIIFTRIKAA